MAVNFCVRPRTFEDRNFRFAYITKQFILFLGLGSIWTALQLELVCTFVELGFSYTLALLFAVAIASGSNFLLNKRLTFKDNL
jgi:putative flippase GtrA